jgi:hypothetical protein
VLRWARRVALPACVCVAMAVSVAGVMAEGAVAALPDGRGYELVSPPDKNGGDVMGDSARIRAADDALSGPMAVGFPSLTAFGDARGTGVATEYLSVRDARAGTNGWSTHAITPAQDPLGALGLPSGDPIYLGEFSDDLSLGVFRAWSPLTDAPNVKDAQNLYLRSDLRSAGAGSYELVSDAVSPLAPVSDIPGNEPLLDGASTDFGHILFESRRALTADAPDDGNLKSYEFDHGTLRLASVLPDGTPASMNSIGGGPLIAAGNGNYTPHMISSDGSRSFFMRQTRPFGCSSSLGPQCFDLYMRVAHAQTVLLNTAEGVAQPTRNQAVYQNASLDGSKAFFLANRPLTADAPTSGLHLYRYDANAPDGAHLTLLDSDSELSDGTGFVEGVIGASADGSYVYFIASSQLIAGGPTPVDSGIYLWHAGEGLRYLGQMHSAEQLDLSDTSFVLSPLEARVTPDGKHLLFMASSGDGLTGYDQVSACTGSTLDGFPGCAEFYVYDAGSNRLTCASCDPSGAPVVDESVDTARVGASAAPAASHLNHPISSDGRRVFFSTQEPLVPEDVNGKIDVYEYEWDGSDPATGSVHLISSGKDTSDSYFMDASADGSDVFFITRQRLVGWDVDGNYDLYDARVGGGVPDPVLVRGCSGDQCQGTPANAPELPEAASVLFSGAGNVKATVRHRGKPRRCRHGFVRRRVHGRVHCVKRRHHRARRAGPTRSLRRAR